MPIVGITLALAGLTAAGASAATNPAHPAGRSTAVTESLVYVPRHPAPPRQDVAEIASAKRAQALRVAAAKRAAAARVAAARAAAVRAAAVHAAAVRVATARREATRAALTRTAGTRASRSTSRAPIAGGNPRAIAASMLGGFGWSSSQFGCLDSLWNRESGWSVSASNPSGAYGIPQALPGSKMGAYGGDWATNPRTQISWGLNYIAARYGTPCGAWSHSQAYNWY